MTESISCGELAMKTLESRPETPNPGTLQPWIKVFGSRDPKGSAINAAAEIWRPMMPYKKSEKHNASMLPYLPTR